MYLYYCDDFRTSVGELVLLVPRPIHVHTVRGIVLRWCHMCI